MRVEYQAVYRLPAGRTVEFDLVKDPSTRGYMLNCENGLRRITWYLDGGLEFVNFKLALDTRNSSDRASAERFMKALLTVPLKPRCDLVLPESKPTPELLRDLSDLNARYAEH
jgi:hypothetical protein